MRSLYLPKVAEDRLSQTWAGVKALEVLDCQGSLTAASGADRRRTSTSQRAFATDTTFADLGCQI